MQYSTKCTNVLDRNRFRKLARAAGLEINTDDGNVERARSPELYPYVVIDTEGDGGFGFLEDATYPRISVPKFEAKLLAAKPAVEVRLTDEVYASIQQDGTVEAGCQNITRAAVEKFILAWQKQVHGR